MKPRHDLEAKPARGNGTFKADLAQANAALKQIRPKGLIRIGAIDPKIEKFNPVCRTYDLSKPDEAAKAKAFIKHQNDHLKRNIYFEIGIPRGRLNKKSAVQDIGWCQDHASDIDPVDNESAAAAKARIREVLKDSGLPTPTYLFSTGSGMLAVWRRKEALKLDTPEAVAQATAINAALRDKLGGKQEEGADHCISVDHFFRVPGTVNYPDAKKIAKGRKVCMAGELEFNGTRYDESELPVVRVAAATSTRAIGAAVDGVNLDTLGISERLKTIIRDGRDDGKPPKDDSASGWRMSALTMLKRAGIADEVVLGIVMDQTNGINSGRSEAFYKREIAKAASFAASATAESLHADFSDEPTDDRIGNARKRTKRSKFEALSLPQIRAKPPVRFIVDEWMPEDSVFMFFGDSNAGKTFVTVTLGCCIASNRSFFGRRTVPGRVLHILGEGKGQLVTNRIDAWIKHTAGDDPEALAALQAYIDDNYKILDISVAVDDEKEVNAFLQANPGGWRIIFVDTVMRNFRGNINEQVDMAKFVAGCDRIRSQTKAVVVPLHHPGNSNKGRGMGTVNLPAALDGIAELRQESNGERVLEIRKLRDAAVALQPKMVLDLESVYLRPGVEPEPYLDFDTADDFPVTNFDLMGEKAPKPRDISSAVLIHKRTASAPRAPRKRTADDEFLIEIFESKATEQKDLVTKTRDKHAVSRKVKRLRALGYLEDGSLKLSLKGETQVHSWRPISAEEDFDDE